MAAKKTLTNPLFNFAEDSYFERTARPVYALFFLLPFIAFYEIGTILINTDVLNQSQVRVVAFVWLQNLLASMGFGGKFVWAAPALAVFIILIALQLASRKNWRFELPDVIPMGLECVLLAVPLIVLSLFLNSSQAPPPPQSEYAPTLSATMAAAADPGHSLLADVVTGVGAGIYEELVFRLILISLLMLLLQDLMRINHRTAVIIAVLVSAALFSAHHHIFFIEGRFAQSAPFDVTEFTFRTLAGVYFAMLYAVRGFGITAGTHAFYDIIATVINAMFFAR